MAWASERIASARFIPIAFGRGHAIQKVPEVFMPTDPQKSEVHESTADASTSPTGGADQEATRGGTAERAGAGDRESKLNPAPPTDVHIVRDETDDGGPLVIESGDPDLNPPRVPQNPFPTEGKPEIDPPVR
jgi:hypothetical protein